MTRPPATGIARLARFRADGLAAFDASPAGLLNALAPWLAFALVGFALALAGGYPRAAIGDLLATVIALLTPAVLSHLLARIWQREAGWLRYAVAWAWCQWIMPPALLLALILGAALVQLGLPTQAALRLSLLALLGYALALNGFIARHALGLSRWRSTALVAVVNLGTAALVTLPVLIQFGLDPAALEQGS
jgi:hypothetical protein